MSKQPRISNPKQPKTVRPWLERWLSGHSRGQIIIMVALSAVVMFAIVGLAIDVGRLYVTKAQLSRAVDAAALAGVLEFPSTTNADAKATAYLALNEPTAVGNITADPINNSLSVSATKSVQMYFLSVIGINTASVTAKAKAGFGIVPVDVYMALDATGSMSGTPITEAKNAADNFIDTLLTANNSDYTLVGLGPFRGCYTPPIVVAEADPRLSEPVEFYAESAPEPIADGGFRQVAFVPPPGADDEPLGQRPPRTRTPTRTPTRTNTPSGPTATRTSTPTPTVTGTATAQPTPTQNPNVQYCVNASTQVTNLTSNTTTLHNGVDAVTATGGTGTNVCNGLVKANDVLFGAGHHTEENTRRFVVLLSDGDNTYNAASYQVSPPSPDPLCTPDTTPQTSDGNVSSSCSGAQTRERELDEKTIALVDSMKASGIEFYVVGFGVCGAPPTSTTCTSTEKAKIGNGDTDTIADQRLLKCMASSAAGSNDHFFYASTAASLPNIFQQIAHQIGHRLIE